MSMHTTRGLFAALWETRLWRFFPFLLIYSIGFATVFPVIPTIITNGFASQAAGKPLDCEHFTPATSPVECQDAHAQAVTWNSWTSFVSGTILSSVFSPAVGRASDVVGRRPFILLGVSLSFAPMLVLMAHVWGWCRIEWYFPMSALGGVVSSFSMTMVALADLLPGRHRATAAGYISAAFSIGVLLGPIAGGRMPTVVAVYTCIGLIGVTMLYILFFIPESAPALRDSNGWGGACTSYHSAAGSGRHTGGRGAGEKELGTQVSGSRGKANGAVGPDAATAGAVRNGAYTPPAAVDAQTVGVGGLGQQGAAGKGSGVLGNGGNGGLDRGSLYGADGECCFTGEEEDASGILKPLLALEGDPIPAVVPHSHELHVPPSATHPHHHGHTVSRRNTGGGSTTTAAHGGDVSAPLLEHVEHGAAGGEGDGGGSSGSSGDMLVGWRIIRNSAYFTKLTLIWVIVSMTSEGAQDLLMQYLQLRLGFNTRDQANLLVIVAGCGLAIKLGLLPGMVRLLGEQWLLVVGLTAYAAECLCFALATSKGAAFAAIAVGSFASLNWPAAVALQTKHVAPENMGAVTGALHGISSIASGIGPLFFAALFSRVSRREPGCVYAPQVVWYVACGLTLSAVALTATLHRSAPKEPLTLASVTGGDRSAATTVRQDKSKAGEGSSRGLWPADKEEERQPSAHAQIQQAAGGQGMSQAGSAV